MSAVLPSHWWPHCLHVAVMVACCVGQMMVRMAYERMVSPSMCS